MINKKENFFLRINQMIHLEWKEVLDEEKIKKKYYI